MFTLKNIRLSSANRPQDYVIHKQELTEAVNMSIWLQKPLLLTGAPGTGKTQLAHKVAYELAKNPVAGFAPFIKEPFEFHTKTTSAASDLFYHYDAIRHFQKKPAVVDGVSENITPHPFIELNALGKAILQSFGKKNIQADEKLKGLLALNRFSDILDEPHSSVILIDEIDKAPHDFPNDLLNEIDHYKFRIQELNQTIEKSKTQNPFPAIVVIMTSNFEKNLPDAFLRRCLFYHIASPESSELYEIVAKRMEPYLKELYADKMPDDKDIALKLKEYNKAVDKFLLIREKIKDKKPATAELLEWVKILELNNFFARNPQFSKLEDEQKTILRYTLPILAKTKDDLDIATKELALEVKAQATS